MALSATDRGRDGTLNVQITFYKWNGAGCGEKEEPERSPQDRSSGFADVLVKHTFRRAHREKERTSRTTLFPLCLGWQGNAPHLTPTGVCSGVCGTVCAIVPRPSKFCGVYGHWRWPAVPPIGVGALEGRRAHGEQEEGHVGPCFDPGVAASAGRRTAECKRPSALKLKLISTSFPGSIPTKIHNTPQSKASPGSFPASQRRGLSILTPSSRTESSCDQYQLETGVISKLYMHLQAPTPSRIA
jgi:hypothetical protein